MKKIVDLSLLLLVGLVVGYFVREIYFHSIKQDKIAKEYDIRQRYPKKIIPLAPDIEFETFNPAGSKFHGPWKTSSGSGEMTCEISKESSEKNFSGVFFGVWNGSDFRYDVKWEVNFGKCSGEANIDGTDYEWTGMFILKEDKCWHFDGTFTGSSGRKGTFSLKQVK